MNPSRNKIRTSLDYLSIKYMQTHQVNWLCYVYVDPSQNLSLASTFLQPNRRLSLLWWFQLVFKYKMGGLLNLLTGTVRQNVFFSQQYSKPTRFHPKQISQIRSHLSFMTPTILETHCSCQDHTYQFGNWV